MKLVMFGCCLAVGSRRGLKLMISKDGKLGDIVRETKDSGESCSACIVI